MVSLLVVACSSVVEMDNSQSCAFTVIKKLKCRERLKVIATTLLVTINRKSAKHDQDTEYAKFCKIKA